MTAQQLILMTGAYGIALIAISYFTRARWQRVAGALAGGIASGFLGWGAIVLGQAQGWWQVPLTMPTPVLMLGLLGLAISLSPVYLITWRVARRFGWRGLVVSVFAAAIIGPPRDYLFAAVYPEWITFAPGMAPIFADAMTYAGWIVLGHVVMFLIAGPACRDPLAQRQKLSACHEQPHDCGAHESSNQMTPVDADERYIALDALRGAALLGVLLVNLDSDFRGSLFARMLNFHSHPGGINRATDWLLAWVFEFKAFTLFSFLFGVGVGIQAERATSRKVNIYGFFIRRFAALLVIGLFHMLLIWNGDILTLYAVCGLLLIPFVKLSHPWLAIVGIAVVLISPYLPFFGSLFPNQAAILAQAELATRVYSSGSFAEIAALRWHEAWRFIAPLLIGSLPRTFGLMLMGIAAWRGRLLQRPAQYRNLLRATFFVAGILGALTTTLQVWSKETGQRPPVALDWLYPYLAVLLAFAYGAGLLLCFNAGRKDQAYWLTRLFAATGRMALSNYLAQSVIFSLTFYSFGFGLFGKLGSAATALFGLTVFVAQLAASQWWLRRFRFGPLEWLWRSLTYGRRQPLLIVELGRR